MFEMNFVCVLLAIFNASVRIFLDVKIFERDFLGRDVVMWY